MNTGNEKAFSEICNLLRLPLMILIVCVHVDYTTLALVPHNALSNGMVFLFTRVFARVSTPAFFFISGYYFFFPKENKESFDLHLYKSKLKRRIKSLLVPYLFWNLLFFVFKFAMDRGEARFSLMQLAGYPVPFAIQFWFIRDLMIMVLCSPLIYWIIRKTKFVSVLLLLVLWLMDTGFEMCNSLLFFFMGAYFSIEKKDVVGLLKKIKYYPLILFFIFIILNFVFNFSASDSMFDLQGNRQVYYLCRTLGMVSVFSAAYFLTKRLKLKAVSIAGSFTFFLFATHVALTRWVCTPLLYKFFNNGSMDYLILYFLPIILSIVASFLAYLALRKVFPKLLAVVCGGRI